MPDPLPTGRPHQAAARGANRGPAAHGAPKDGNGNGAHGEPERVEVKSLTQLAQKYSFSEPDAFVGSESSEYVLDYGEPKVLADSAQRTKPGWFERLLDRI
jgi:hypothetical protein